MNQILSPSDYERTVLAFAPTGHITPTIKTPKKADLKPYIVKEQQQHLKGRILEVVALLHSLQSSPDLVAIECGRIADDSATGRYLKRRSDVETLRLIPSSSPEVQRRGYESKAAYNHSTSISGQIGTLRTRFKDHSGLNIFTERQVGTFNLQGENILTYEREIDDIVDFIIENFQTPLTEDRVKAEAKLKISRLLSLSGKPHVLITNIHALNEIVDQLNVTKGTNPVRTIVDGFQTWLDTAPTMRRNEYPSAPHYNGTFISGDPRKGFQVVPTITRIQANKGYIAAFREIVFTKGTNEIGRYNLGFQVPVGVQIGQNTQQVNGITKKHRYLKTYRGAIENGTLTCAQMENLLSVLPIYESEKVSKGVCTVRI